VIGPVITAVKQLVLRLLFFVFDDLARQTDAAVRRLETALGAEVAAREAVHTDLRMLSQRTDDLDADLDRLQLAPRLASLVRGLRARPAAPAPASPALATPEAQPATRAGAAFDYLAFEARFRPEETVRERQQAYLEALRGSKRVADLGCGRGELVELLKEAGVAAYGVEIEPDFIDILRDKGLEAVAEDALEHLRRLEPGDVDGIVASHLVEHLPAAAVSELISLAGEKLAPEGTLIVETPNPESLVAGSVNFHRDLTHVRPIHPDTLAFLCESAGFSKVEVRRLSPVPEDERLPAPGDGRLDEVVERLNELLYGYQDYAVVARLS
jgi:O-antigen chain-terminating methyltransferase